MKKTLLLMMAMAFVTMGAFAQESNAPAASGQMQPRPTVEERAKRQADHINEVAKLSADQYAKVLAIAKDFANQKEALRASGAQGDDMKTKFKALNDQEQAQLKTVLTADQMTKVEAAKKERLNPRGQ